jgi:hypothetical protein
VDRNFYGLTQAQRARFVFESRPTSFEDFERLCDRKLVCAEQMNEQTSRVKSLERGIIHDSQGRGPPRKAVFQYCCCT